MTADDENPPAADSYVDARCAAVYDIFEGPERDDLDVYAAMVEEFGAASVVDVGCGTGTFATMLAGRGVEVVGVDPSALALNVARTKPNSDQVTWVHGVAADLPPLQVDIAFMTANVAQEILGAEKWSETLLAIRRILRPGGLIVFESRIPEREAWLEWTKENTYSVAEVDGEGTVESWVEYEASYGGFVDFIGVLVFERDGRRVEQRSWLQFRDRDELTKSLEDTGFNVEEIRDAPDRPGREFVFIARKGKYPYRRDVDLDKMDLVPQELGRHLARADGRRIVRAGLISDSQPYRPS